MNKPFEVGIKAQDLIGRVLRKSLKKNPTEYLRTSPAADSQCGPCNLLKQGWIEIMVKPP
jgi:hypothetical protein